MDAVARALDVDETAASWRRWSTRRASRSSARRSWAHLWDRLLERDDVTCLVVSNREALRRRADQVVVPEEGRLESLQVRKGRLWQAPLSKASSPS